MKILAIAVAAVAALLASPTHQRFCVQPGHPIAQVIRAGHCTRPHPARVRFHP